MPALGSSPRTLAYHSALVASRVRDRLARTPAVAVLAGRGDSDNFGDDTAEYESFDPSVWEGLFDIPWSTASTTSPEGGF